MPNTFRKITEKMWTPFGSRVRRDGGIVRLLVMWVSWVVAIAVGVGVWPISVGLVAPGLLGGREAEDGLPDGGRVGVVGFSASRHVWAAETDASLQRWEYAGEAMAEPLKIILYAPEEALAEHAAQAALDRILQLNDVLSDYDAESELRRVCARAGSGEAVRVSEDLFRVLAVGQVWAQRTDGAFDMTVGPVVRLWRRARRTHQMPPPTALQEARQLVGYQNVVLDPDRQTVLLKKPGIRLDPGGIGAGYAVDEALRVLSKQGFSRALIDLGGDIRLGEPPPDRPGWRIGVPGLDPNTPPREFLLLSRCAVATSGDAWQFVELNGKRYSHIIDPQTGVPLVERCSVTVVAPDGLTADVLGTAVTVLGPEKGMKLVEQTPGAAAWMIRVVEGRVLTLASSRWKDLPRDQAPESTKPSSAASQVEQRTPPAGPVPKPKQTPDKNSSEAPWPKHSGAPRP